MASPNFLLTNAFLYDSIESIEEISNEKFNQANYLLDQQLRQLEKQFLEKGGFTEKLYQARQQVRRK